MKIKVGAVNGNFMQQLSISTLLRRELGQIGNKE